MPKRAKKVHSLKAQQRAAAKQLAQAEREAPRGNRHPHGAPWVPDPTSADTPPPPGTLGHRFYSLPQELRNEIFAQLLVRPVKWNIKHRPDCPLSTVPLEGYLSQMGSRPQISLGVCASQFHETTLWRHCTDPITVDPWRSRWAPEQQNPYVCTACYDYRHRPRPFPTESRLPCLCARRDHLETLLVCRRWYAEAGAVFYTRNTFAFGNMRECSQFLTFLSPRWKALISKVSLLVFTPLPKPAELVPKTAMDEPIYLDIPCEGKNSLGQAWQLLRDLPALSELELDAILLTREHYVEIFRRFVFPNLRRINFVQSDPHQVTKTSRDFVWPRFGARMVIEDSRVAQCVARHIRGLEYVWAPCHTSNSLLLVTPEFHRYIRLVRAVKDASNEDEDRE
ncbi:hypothetical protein GGS23DRAFT_204367 [Durotheca rogersii]|uniref:uncharacterized protein n=1 Tax=Durotheca rogersii TaxID=419775 RepID=UPI00221F9B7D|nr:uncharacterized protein GGS23DRAFT_204367 [Durotheca rogersii]KAI5860999.1 hypothetical protein GGS23DRAFT_204367 [Durotheca rogersii]